MLLAESQETSRNEPGPRPAQPWKVEIEESEIQCARRAFTSLPS
jgi:hypothetical protein